jgi:hypothetical protein
MKTSFVLSVLSVAVAVHARGTPDMILANAPNNVPRGYGYDKPPPTTTSTTTSAYATSTTTSTTPPAYLPATTSSSSSSIYTTSSSTTSTTSAYAAPTTAVAVAKPYGYKREAAAPGAGVPVVNSAHDLIPRQAVAPGAGVPVVNSAHDLIPRQPAPAGHESHGGDHGEKVKRYAPGAYEARALAVEKKGKAA